MRRSLAWLLWLPCDAASLVYTLLVNAEIDLRGAEATGWFPNLVFTWVLDPLSLPFTRLGWRVNGDLKD